MALGSGIVTGLWDSVYTLRKNETQGEDLTETGRGNIFSQTEDTIGFTEKDKSRKWEEGRGGIQNPSVG